MARRAWAPVDEVALCHTRLADPPWSYRAYRPGRGNGLAAHHYPTMGLAAIKALPVGEIAARDSALLLWVTGPCLAEGLAVMAAWGFRYKTVAFAWVKTDRSGAPCFGLGHYTRSATEVCLVGTKGSPVCLAHDVRQVIVAPRKEHSRKPIEQYGRIERLFAGRRLELFARGPARDGWDVWGLEAELAAAALARYYQ